MITGRMFSESYVQQAIREGSYATSFREAFRKFGTNFVAVSPIYPSCEEILAKVVIPGSTVEDCIYVSKKLVG